MVLSNYMDVDEKTLKIGIILSQHYPSTESDDEISNIEKKHTIDSENEKSELNGEENISDNDTSNENLNDDSDDEDSDDEDSEDSDDKDSDDNESDDEKTDDDDSSDDSKDSDDEDLNDDEKLNSEQYDKLGKSFSDFCRTNKRRDIRNMQKMIDNYDLKLCDAINLFLKSKKHMCLLKEKRDFINFDLEKVRNAKYENDVTMFNYMLNHYKNLIMHTFEKIPIETIDVFSKMLSAN